MMNQFLRGCLFISAFAPVLIMNVIAQYANAGFAPQMLYWLAAGILGCLLPVLIVLEIGRRSESLPFSAKKVESQDWMLFVFVAAYFFPLVIRLEDNATLLVVLVLATAGLSAIEQFPCHPFLHLCRIRFYKVEGADGIVYVMITRRRILAAKDIKNVRQIAGTMLMEG